MKNNRGIKITAFTLALAATLASCGAEEENNDPSMPADTTSSTPQTESASESPAETEKTETSPTESDTDTEKETETSSETTESVLEEAKENEPLYTYKSSMQTYDFKVTEDGSYSFKHSGNDDVAWNVYILDEEFTDGIRYLYSNYTPDGVTEFTADLKAGQYVYLICTQNEWTNSADDFVDTEISVYKN